MSEVGGRRPGRGGRPGGRGTRRPPGDGGPGRESPLPAGESRRVRLFFALDVPEEARLAVVGWRERALAGRDDLRPVPPEALHITLAFLGHREEAEIDRIARTAFAAAHGLPPARMRGLAARPVPARRPRLFALDLDDQGGGAARIQVAVASALEAERLLEPERRPFWPHLTFARVRSGRRAEPLTSVPPPAVPFSASELTLYRSLLRREGARYEPLARLGLGG